MGLDRFYFGDALGVQGDRIELEGPEALHMLRVMRKKQGDEVTLFDGAGREARALIVSCDRRRAELALSNDAVHSPTRESKIELAIALPRGGEIVELIRRSIEAGADIIRPLMAERSVHRSDKKSEEKRLQKMDQAAIAALKQCGRNSLPKWMAPTKLTSLHLAPGQLGVFGSTGSGKTLRKFEKEQGGTPRDLVIVIGPEGGLSQGEEEFLIEAGFSALTLGRAIYRVETAAVAMLSYFSCASQDELV